jgi:hypothetical protein
VDPDQNSHGSSMASTFVKYDFLNHKKDGEHAGKWGISPVLVRSIAWVQLFFFAISAAC